MELRTREWSLNTCSKRDLAGRGFDIPVGFALSISMNSLILFEPEIAMQVTTDSWDFQKPHELLTSTEEKHGMTQAES